MDRDLRNGETAALTRTTGFLVSNIMSEQVVSLSVEHRININYRKFVIIDDLKINAFKELKFMSSVNNFHVTSLRLSISKAIAY